MPSQPSDQMTHRRLQLSLSCLLQGLKEFLAAVSGNEGEASRHWLNLSEGEVQRTEAYLSQLGLEADARQLADAANALIQWHLHYAFEEALARSAAVSPERDQGTRSLFGNFPSLSELEAHSEERRQRNFQVVTIARQLTHQLRQLLSVVSAPMEINPPTPKSATDDSAFRPAKEFLDANSCPTYKQLRAVLKANPEIRTRKPSPQRLEIHAGDWQRVHHTANANAFNALDTNTQAGKTAAQFLSEVHERQETIRRQKSGK